MHEGYIVLQLYIHSYTLRKVSLFIIINIINWLEACVCAVSTWPELSNLCNQTSWEAHSLALSEYPHQCSYSQTVAGESVGPVQLKFQLIHMNGLRYHNGLAQKLTCTCPAQRIRSRIHASSHFLLQLVPARDTL